MANAELENSDQLFPFMKLLPELRICVYEYLFEDLAASIMPSAISLIQLKRLIDYQRPHLRNILALLQTSRIFRTECMEVCSRLQKIHAAKLPDLILKTEHEYSRCFCDFKKLVELYTLRFTMGILEAVLHVVKHGPKEGHGKRGQSVAALETAQGADASESATKRIKK
jgi:hypothetical protein